MTQVDVTNTTNRRRALGQIANAAAVTAAGATLARQALATELDDPHIAWGVEWFGLIDFWNSPGSSDRDCDTSPVWARIEELGRLIVDTPTTTVPGALVQVDAALEWLGANDRGRHSDGLHEVRALRNARLTLDAMRSGRA